MIRWFKRQKNLTKFAIGCPVAFILACAIGFIVLVIIFIINPPPFHTTSTTSTPTPTTQPARVPTHTPLVRPKPTTVPTVVHSAPTVAPTAQPTQPNALAAVSGPTTIGLPLSHFIARYGQPGSGSKEGLYFFEGKDFFVIALKENAYAVSGINYSNIGGKGWPDQESATTSCRAFLPDDATYTRTVDLGSLASERVYVSQSIAPLFQASQFTDENGNNTTPGTLAIVYDVNISNPNQIVDCSIQVGLQAK